MLLIFFGVMNLIELEFELKKRFNYPYAWGQKQNDFMDELTDFIYKISNFNELIKYFSGRKHEFENPDSVFHYMLNRWYNFWSAKAVEYMFSLSHLVKPAENVYDKNVDFFISGIPFDLKTSIFPRNYPSGYSAEINKNDMIRWLYQNQSSERRQHFHNRLFIILHKKDGNHWMLKADLHWLNFFVKNYLKNFDTNKLTRFRYNSQVIISDLIWAVN